MRGCVLCKKKALAGGVSLFQVPKDVERRNRWSQICGKELKGTSRLCSDHFDKKCIVAVGQRMLLLPNAEPKNGFECNEKDGAEYTSKESPTGLHNQEESSVCSSDNYSFNAGDPKKGLVVSWEELTKAAAAAKRISRKGKKKYNSADRPRYDLSGYRKKVLKRSFMAPQLSEPIVQMPVVKSVSCSGFTQTNTRLCGLVEASDFADEFRFNCFYCYEVFPLEKWKSFVIHLKCTHFNEEEAFQTSKYLSKEHDYTPINLPPQAPAKAAIEPIVCNATSVLSSLVDPLGSVHNPFESVVFNSNVCYAPYKIETKPYFVTNCTESKFKAYKKKSKRKFISSSRFYSKLLEPQVLRKTALSRCLKRAIENEIKPPKTPPPVEHEDCETYLTIDEAKQTEIWFEHTPSPVVNLLLDNMKNFPVLWRFDDEPFNEDFFEAVENLCNVINRRFSMNIDNLKMRRSINRILRFFCYLYPNENNDQFTYYYDKCATFLPSVNEIAYARCSQCYVCYSSDFDLKLHLVEEQKYLEWPYKCPQCRECFRLWNEFEFHKHLPHYDGIFRCQPCKLSFFRRLTYRKHMVEEHESVNKSSRFKCDICGIELETVTDLKTHKKTHGETPHKCHLCPQSYHAKSRLELHLKIHRQEPDFMCEICGKKFFRQPALKIHMAKHTGEKVTCKICNLKLRKSSLGRHLRTVHVAHAGPVGKSFFNGMQISPGRILRARPKKRLHQKIGSERKYECKICKIDFDNYKLVVEHNKEIHSDLPRWPCKMCTTEFGTKLNLKGHYRKKHNLHPLQVYKLVEENEDLNCVLSIEVEEIDEFVESVKKSRNNKENATKRDLKPSVKTDLLPDEFYFAEEKIHSSTIQDEIMKAVDDDIETQDIKIDYMNDMFTDFVEQH